MKNIQGRASDVRENQVNVSGVSKNSNANHEKQKSSTQGRKRSSLNHQASHHGTSVEQPFPGNERSLHKVSQKKISMNKHHNLSQHAATTQMGQNQNHHMTSKIKKLVSHKQIDTNLPKGKNKKNVLS